MVQTTGQYARIAALSIARLRPAITRGPHIYTYRALLTELAARAGSRPLLMPIPFAIWHAVGFFGELLPSPPITRNQVDLIEADSIAAPGMPGFEALQIQPHAMEEIIPELLENT